MNNLFKHLSEYDINLMVAKHELRGQPLVKFLSQRNVFGSDVSEEDDFQWMDSSVYITTESGREQKISFCDLTGRWSCLMSKCRISIVYSNDNEGGHVLGKSDILVSFESEHDYPRAVAICYLLENGLLSEESLTTNQ